MTDREKFIGTIFLLILSLALCGIVMWLRADDNRRNTSMIKYWHDLYLYERGFK